MTSALTPRKFVRLFAAMLIAVAALLAVSIGPGHTMAAKNAAPQADQLQIKRGDIVMAQFTVEVADDKTERAQGLMFRQSMAPDHAMLFVYYRPGPIRMWMKNTFIPLDMLFADQTGMITHIHKGARPHDLTPINGGRQVQFVVEIVAGRVTELGLEIGDTIIHKDIKN